MIDRRGATVSLIGDLRIVPTARRPGSRLAVIAAAHVVACWPILLKKSEYRLRS
jgi:hypothetical protein